MISAELAELDRLLPLTDDDSLCQMQSLLWIARADLIDAVKQLGRMRDLARKLASLHVHGNGYCSACFSANYHDVSGRTPELIHNEGCPVIALKELTNG